MRKVVFTLILVVVILVIGMVFYVFYKPARTADSEKAAFKLTSAKLFNDYSDDEKKANALYLNKVLEVEGKVDEVTTDQNGARSIVLKEEEDILGVVCTVDEAEMKDVKLAPVEKGDKVVIKGICMGYDMEVKMNKCIIVGLSKDNN